MAELTIANVHDVRKFVERTLRAPGISPVELLDQIDDQFRCYIPVYDRLYVPSDETIAEDWILALDKRSLRDVLRENFSDGVLVHAGLKKWVDVDSTEPLSDPQLAKFICGLSRLPYQIRDRNLAAVSDPNRPSIPIEQRALQIGFGDLDGFYIDYRGPDLIRRFFNDFLLTSYYFSVLDSESHFDPSEEPSAL